MTRFKFTAKNILNEIFFRFRLFFLKLNFFFSKNKKLLQTEKISDTVKTLTEKIKKQES